MNIPARCLSVRLALAALLIVLAGCAAAVRTHPDAAFFRDLVAERYVAPFRNGDVETWIDQFADDAVALHNRRPAIEGKAGIRAFGEAVRENFRLERFDVRVTDVRGSGQWVTTRGDFVSRFVSRADGSAPFGEERGKFLLIWERQENGEWKIVLDMGNSGS